MSSVNREAFEQRLMQTLVRSQDRLTQNRLRALARNRFFEVYFLLFCVVFFAAAWLIAGSPKVVEIRELDDIDYEY